MSGRVSGVLGKKALMTIMDSSIKNKQDGDCVEFSRKAENKSKEMMDKAQKKGVGGGHAF